MAGELDLAAFLSDDSASDDGEIPRDGGATFPLRTIDEILNSPSSSDDSEPESGTRPRPKPRDQIVPQSSVPAHEKPEIQHENVTAHAITGRSRSTSLDLPSSSSSSTSSSSDTLSSLVLRGLSDRPVPPLFRGVRVANPRPGAALAAAAAASRSVTTPHAAAIKLRRVDPASRSLQKESSGGIEEEVKKVEVEREFGASSSTSSSTGNLEEFSVSKDANENLNEKESNRDNVELEIELKSVEPTSRSSENVLEAENVRFLNDNAMSDSVEPTDNSVGHEIKEEKGEELVNDPELVAELGITHDEQNSEEIQSKASQIDQISPSSDKIIPTDDKPETPISPELVIAENISTEIDNSTENDNLIEKAVEIARKADKKLKSSMKPLEYYEEIEKRQASYGLHYEEGAVAQPMRLEGIRRGPPAVGYLQIDLDNAATRLISSQGFKREHGSPQVVAVHRAYVAFGMSRGSVFVVPSKYSIHSADNMDSKV